MPRCVKTAHDFEKKWRSDDVRLQEEASFSSLLLPKKILVGLENAGYKIPSPIQLESIPVGRFGRDLLVQAKSGTGKTLVFTVIALESLSDIKYPQVLIMAPTREIALQICDVVRAVGSAFKGLTCNCFIGGSAIDTDIERVHGCQIIVGTPGRLKHLISLGILPTNSIRLLVLDEADVLLESNFKDDLDFIFVSLPKDKQVIATSATYPRELRTLTRQYFRKVYLARLNRNELTLLGMVHYIQVLEIHKMSLLAYKAKLAALEKVVTSINFTQCLVFCNLLSRVESLCYDIRNWGFTSTFISSAKEQCDRIRAIECLKRFKCKILVTSDVTARGIDAENVDLVINFDKPLSTEIYFHRCGRAGRYGAKGVAITFLEKDEVVGFELMKVKHNLKAYNLPDPIPANLINIRPADYESSTENSEGDDLSDEVSQNDSNGLNGHSNSDIDSKVTKESIGADSSLLCNGKVSFHLNGHVSENINESASFNGDTNSKLSVFSEIDAANTKDDSIVNNEINISVSNCVKDESNSEKLAKDVDSQIVSQSVAAEPVKSKNSFLEYLHGRPVNTESPFGTEFLSDSSVVNNESTELTEPQELTGASILETNDKSLQNNIDETLEIDRNTIDSKNSKLDVSEGEIKDNFEKLNPSSDTIQSVVQKSQEVSPDSSIPTIPVVSESDKVSEVGLTEAKSNFIPNKIQLSVGKFLMDDCDNKFNSTEFNNSNLDCSASETEYDLDVKKTLKDIRGDLSGFYCKVYKSYQAENLDDSAFQKIKDHVVQQRDEEMKKSAENNITKTINDKLGKEIDQNAADLKSSVKNVCDNSLNSVVSKESISPQENNASGVGQVFERFVFKDCSTENSSNSSGSNESLYLTLKSSFDSMKASAKSKSETNLQVNQKSEKDNIKLKNNKFSLKADKKLGTQKQSESFKDSSSDEDTKFKSEEAYGAKSKLYNGRQNFKYESNKRHQAKNKPKNNYKTKPCNEVLTSDKTNRTVTTTTESSPKNPHHSQYAQSTSTPYSKLAISGYEQTNAPNNQNMTFAKHRHDHTTSAANYGNMPFPSHHHDHTTSAVNYGNMPFPSHLHDHTTSAVNCRNMPFPSHHHDHNRSTVNYGDTSIMSHPHGHTTLAVNASTNQIEDQTIRAGNYPNFPSMNYPQFCQWQSHPSSHQNYGHVPHNCRPNQLNSCLSCRGRGCHQLGNVCNHNHNANWYQMYMKQWRFIHSSLY